MGRIPTKGFLRRNSPFLVLVLLAVVGSTPGSATLPSSIRVGSVFLENEQDTAKAFRLSVESLKARGLLNDTEIQVGNQYATPQDHFQLFSRACKELGSEIITLFGPSDAVSDQQLASVSTALGIPMISIAPRPIKSNLNGQDHAYNTASLAISLHPTQSQLIGLVTDLAKELKWKDATVIHDGESGIIDPTSLTESLQMLGPVSVYQKGSDLRSTLIKLRLRGARNIIVDTGIESVPSVIHAALETGMMTASYNYIFTMLDMKAGNWSRLSFSEALVLGFNAVDEAKLKEFNERFATAPETTSDPLEELGGSGSGGLQPTLKVALAMDAVDVMASGLEYYDATEFAVPAGLSCDGDKKWESGQELKEAYAMSTFNGISGPVSFTHGERLKLDVEILKLKYNNEKAEPSFIKVGNWSTGNIVGEVVDGIQIYDSSLLTNEQPQVNKTLIVTTRPGICVEASENGSYKGFCVDVMNEIAAIAGFSYKWKSVGDGRYGAMNPVTKQWDGMIGEVMRGEADVALADLTVTAAREKAVDFTAPFMHTSLAILYKNFEPSTQELSTLLSPFSLWVWVSIVLAFFVTSICLRLVAWLSPFQKDDIILPGTEHHPSLGQDMSWINSMWLLASTLVLRGSDIRIQAISSRTVAIVWWLFSLVTLIIYASLVSHWFDPGSMPPSHTVNSLLYKNPNLEFGMVKGGSTQRYLETTVREDIRRVWWKIEKTPEGKAFYPDAASGIAEVKRGKGRFAFVGEGQAFEEAVNSDCSLHMISGIDDRSFAPAVAKGSELRDKITQALLTLREKGTLHQLETKWWSARTCVETGGRPQVQMMNFIGPLTLLVFGMVAALIIAMIERLLYHRRSHRGFFRTSNGENGNGKIAINQIDTDSN